MLNMSTCSYCSYSPDRFLCIRAVEMLHQLSYHQIVRKVMLILTVYLIVSISK